MSLVVIRVLGYQNRSKVFIFPESTVAGVEKLFRNSRRVPGSYSNLDPEDYLG